MTKSTYAILTSNQRYYCKHCEDNLEADIMCSGRCSSCGSPFDLDDDDDAESDISVSLEEIKENNRKLAIIADELSKAVN